MGLTTAKSRMAPGNLGSTLIKRSYLLLEVILQFLAVADMVAMMNARWPVKMDRPYLIAIITLLALATLLNVLLIFTLAFHNMKIPPSRKEMIKVWSPIIQFVLLAPCCVLVQLNHMSLLFSVANVIFFALSAVHLHTFLKESFVKVLMKCCPCAAQYQTQDESNAMIDY